MFAAFHGLVTQCSSRKPCAHASCLSGPIAPERLSTSDNRSTGPLSLIGEHPSCLTSVTPRHFQHKGGASTAAELTAKRPVQRFHSNNLSTLQLTVLYCNGPLSSMVMTVLVQHDIRLAHGEPSRRPPGKWAAIPPRGAYPSSHKSIQDAAIICSYWCAIT